MPEYEYDRFGYCVMCSKQVIKKIEIKGKSPQLVKMPDWAEETVLLSDGSKMRVCVCKQCIDSVPDNFDVIMKKVYKGWEHDIIEKGWPDERREAYLNRYGALKIVGVA